MRRPPRPLSLPGRCSWVCRRGEASGPGSPDRMCGIAGFLRADGAPADVRLLRRMTDVIAHRGPDGEGFHVDGPLGLGHRRLAIIDLDSGAQPMVSPDGAVWITYNGEVYNYRELRTELEAL